MKTVRNLCLLLNCFLGALHAQITLNSVPARVLGQDSAAITNINPNLVEGREFDTPEGIAIDTSTNPPALYVVDSANNRVLGFRNAIAFANGQHADIVIGQPNFVTTLPAGPSQSTPNGLQSPTGIAVDKIGNVYVVDGGNNRILRFPQPFAQPGIPVPDIVLGQPSFSTNGANQGGISASTLSLTSNGSVAQAYIAFDSTGNLWASDSGNNRVLRFNANVLGSQAASGPAADLVLGQTNFVTGTYNPPTANPLLSVTAFTSPDGIAFDAAGRLFVAESTSSQRSRVLMWAPPFSLGQPASRILGVDTATPQLPTTSPYQFNAGIGSLFPIGNGIGVVDTFDNRILIFPPVEQWTAGTTYQAAIEVAGQADFSSNSVNLGDPAASASGLSLPGSAAFFNNELYIADSLNNRVIVMPQNGASFGPATAVLGQDLMTLNAPNLVEGREFDFGNATTGYDAGVAVDLSSAVPHFYVADTYNNRILGYNDLRSLQTGQKADIVVGQPDFQQVLINYPSNNPSTPNASGLYAPVGLAVDSNGDLYVADSRNGRVLRFPQPFANYQPGVPEQANLVLGQSSFAATTVTDPTDRTMAQPYGLAFTLAGGLLVSDVALNRVLYFAALPQNLTSGMVASMVFGQPDFNSSSSGSGAGQMNAPHHIATDTDDRLYVADTGNQRIGIFNRAPLASLGQPADQFLTSNLSSPRGIYVSAATGEIWVADLTAGAVRFPAFNQLIAAGSTPNGGFQDPGGPLAAVEDGWGNLYLADAAHRVGIYYATLTPMNAANFLNPNILAPGMIAALFSQGNPAQFGSQSAQASSLPLPTQLNGIEVLFNGSPVPLFYAGPTQINFQVPSGAPQTGTVDLQVIDLATGRVVGVTAVGMTQALPGFFTQAGNGIGAAAALNQDNTLNSQTNPAAQGTVVTLFGTGQGFISGGPPDGNISNAPVAMPQVPTLIMGTGPVPAANIKYSGLAPTLVGVWQMNVQIPDTVITTPTNPTQVVAIEDNVPSGGGGLGRAVIIYVKQK